MRLAFVDGMAIDAPVALDGEGAAPPGPGADWSVSFGRGVPGAADRAGIVPTGDVRGSGSGAVWARFGRRDRLRMVSLEGVADLWALPGMREARLCHDRGPAWDLPALRRVSPYLAALQGRTALHAASVVLAEGAVLLCAHSGVGKSSLALSLDRQGVPVLGDDHVVLDTSVGGGVGAFPSFPFVDVDVDVVVDADARSLPGMEGAQGEKGSVPLVTPRPPGPVPVIAVAFLERGERVEREPMPAAQALVRLLRDFVFVADPADDGAQSARLDACARLLAAAPPARLVIPTGLDRLPATASAVAALWGGSAHVP